MWNPLFLAFLQPVRYIQQFFLPNEDGLSLHVESSGQNVTLRLQWRAETQGEIIDSFSDFVEEV